MADTFPEYNALSNNSNDYFDFTYQKIKGKEA